MKLVLAGRLVWEYNSFLKSLATYKYRDDVILTGYLQEKDLAELVASAYGLVYPSLFEGFGVPMLEAMASHVPVITAVNSAMQEIAGDAAMYADPENFAAIADKIMLLYKNEYERADMIQRGIEVNKQFTWNRTAELLWRSIEKAIG